MIRGPAGVSATAPPRIHPSPPSPAAPRSSRPALVLAVVLALLTTACGVVPTSSGSNHKHGVTVDTRPLPPLVAGHGGTATVALSAIPTTLNDHTVVGDTEATQLVASTVWVQVFQTVGPGLKPTLDTDVVQSAEVVSVDPQTVVYQIAPKAVWSDGVPITASDFQYAWQSQRGGATDIDGSPDSVASTLGYRDILSVVASGAGRTVTVTFRTPYADWESLFDDLLPAHIAETVGWNTGFDHFDSHVLVSAGPWLIKNWIPGQEVVLERNPRWWGSVPRYRTIVLEAVTDPSVLARDVLTRQVTVAAPSTFDAALMSELSAVPKTESETSLGTTMLQLDFNVRHAPLDSIPIRQGIAHAIDRMGMVTRVTRPLEHYAWQDGSHLFANVQSSYEDNGAGYERVDRGAADDLRRRRLGGRRPRDLDLHGAPVTLDLTWSEDDPWSAATGPLLASQLVGAGFDVDTEPVTGTQFFDTVLPSGAFELALVPVQATAYPSQLAGAFSSTAAAGSPAWPRTGPASTTPAWTRSSQRPKSQLSANQASMTYQEIDQDLWRTCPPSLCSPNLNSWPTRHRSPGSRRIPEDWASCGGSTTGPPWCRRSTPPTPTTKAASRSH